MSFATKSFLLAQVAVRRMSSTAAPKGEVPEGYKKLLAKMEKYQVDDGVPIHLKGGLFDRILYKTTMVLTVVGVGMTLYTIYDMSFPKKID